MCTIKGNAVVQLKMAKKYTVFCISCGRAALTFIKKKSMVRKEDGALWEEVRKS